MSMGRFITFEGGEGAGKSTQVKRLTTRLAETGIEVMATREPGGSPGAEAIRSLLLHKDCDWDRRNEALLHYAARRDHVVKAIQPALRRGAWVVCDRFSDSTMAYQGYGHELGAAAIKEISDLALGDLGKPGLLPDLTIILDLDTATGLARAQGRGQGLDRYEAMESAFHQRLRQGFHQIASGEPDRCFLIDASRPEAEVGQSVADLVSQKLGVRLS